MCKPTARVWGIWTVLVLLLLGSLPAAEPDAGTRPPAAPLFTDQEWERTGGTTPTTAPTPDVVPAVTSILASLVVVAGIAVGLGLLVKRFGMRRIMPGRGRHLEVIEQVAVGYKRSVCLIRIADQVLVLGHGEQAMSHLATLPASILDLPRAVPLPPAGTEVPPASGFRKALDQALGRKP